MSIFVCHDCGCVENTATCGYWMRDRSKPAVCSACDPRIGKWHGVFPKAKATQDELDRVDPESGYIR